jgi:hypothetical protein
MPQRGAQESAKDGSGTHAFSKEDGDAAFERYNMKRIQAS